MMMGSLEEAILGAQVKPDVEDVVNDLDIDEEELEVEKQEVNPVITLLFKHEYT